MPVYLQTGLSSCVPMSSYPITTMPFAGPCLGSIAGAVGAGIGACISAAAATLIETIRKRKENMAMCKKCRMGQSTRAPSACTAQVGGRRATETLSRSATSSQSGFCLLDPNHRVILDTPDYHDILVVFDGCEWVHEAQKHD